MSGSSIRARIRLTALLLAPGELGRIPVESFDRKLCESGQHGEANFHPVHFPTEMTRHERDVPAGCQVRKKASILDDISEALTEP